MDDGQGFNLEKIKDRAVSRGFLTQEDIENVGTAVNSLYENDKQRFFTATQEQEKILREAYNLGIAAMLENMAKEKGLSYYDDMDKLVAEFNQNTIFLVLQVTENDIHMHRIYKTDSKQLF